MTDLPPDFFRQDVDTVARRLIGMTILVDGVGGRILETEAYDAADPASHSYAGRTARNAAMFGPVGHSYVYRIYGLHHCLNIVCGTAGSAVLIRALMPEQGLDRMRDRRGAARKPVLLCAGPGRLCQALGIDLALDGHSLAAPPFQLVDHGIKPPIVSGPRIGITRGTERSRRFGLSGTPGLSRPFPSKGTAPQQEKP
ncbi:DNA-3-methyladenine glycosylase [Sphingomonadaceae bacterium jetA1]|jgi:DNA-3-methyladenine glycosylase|uniref:DNA-3-methyladenine glycosylase n=1 Tax=Facivitalis istanbulensis TaxID=3075838 RepID=UPI0034703B5B